MTDTEILRQAAAEMRQDDQGPVILAVADWLDNAASRLPYSEYPRPEFSHALAIAKAHLSGESA